MKADMSPAAVTQRLRRTAELRRLCLALRRKPSARVRETTGDYRGKPSARREARACGD